MLIECQNCGAPLKADGSQMFVECQYCGRSNKVASSKTIAMQAPTNWQPPAQWDASQHVKTAAVGAATTAAVGAGVSTVISLVVGVVVLLAVGGAVAATVLSSGSGSGGFLGPSWDGDGPFRCGGNDEVVIEGVTTELPDDTAITAALNCDVTIRDSHITAREGIDASGNGVVRLENTTILATGVGIRAGLNKRIELVDSVVVADGVGVEASMNAEIMLQGGRIQGSPVAVTTNMNAELDNRGGELIDAP